MQLPPQRGFFRALLVSPEDQAQVWSPYSQRVELIWTPVEGAAYYGVEVECFNCTGREEWSPWAIEGPLTSNSATILGPTSDWQMHRVGRWRVWAVDLDGYTSAASAWRTYFLTR